MKEKLTIIILILSVFGVSSSFDGKYSSHPIGLDKIQSDFTALNETLPPDANISIQIISGADVDTSTRQRVFFILRYIMTPRYFSADPAECDTVLTIFDNAPTQSEFMKVLGNRKLIWTQSKVKSVAFLTCKNK